VDPQGNVFFGLGCDNWHEAYRVNKESGKSDYNIRSERGTILKLSPDFKTREAICTGLRFTVSLAFNANGDLFATDQEGATWLPNGNPFDELLHIQPGKHYGFPPRHPRYLPNVIDEPSVFDYAPQHQSTCGLHFNERVAGGTSVFGPAWWQGDALVSGESRGKIWRTKLVKSATGYVAQNELIACLKMLTIDAVPTPQGDLLVTCHTGKPDWGTGPEGNGKLFKISYSEKNAPQPIFAYAASPTETRVVFDRPLDPAKLKNLTKQSSIRMGRYVSAADRFESFAPGYQAVKDQETIPQFELPVLSAGLSADKRSIILQTATRKEALNYAVKLPESGNTERPHDASRHELAQHSTVDVLCDLTGIQVDWQATKGKEKWEGWIPHLDLTVARGLTGASEEHKHLFEVLKKPGRLTLRCQLDLGLMLHPKTQPGAKLDYEYPPETVTVVFKSDGKLKLKNGPNFKMRQVNEREYQVTTTPKTDEWVPIELSLVTGDCEPRLDVSWFTAEDARPRPLQLHRILMPWAKPHAEELQQVGERRIPEIAGGDWARGKKVFFGEQAACFKCHQFAGEGGRIGPDLSNLPQRDYASVYKDITEPSAAINPDHLAYNIELKNGESVTGVIVEDTTDALVVGQATGQSTRIAKEQIVSRKASSISLMPEGLLQGLSNQQRKDLFMFLLTEEAKQAKK
jgi:putative heme-binding domain-containing protein